MSHTPKLPADDRLELLGFRRILLAHQPGVRGCAVLQVRAEGASLSYEYRLEEGMDEVRLAAVLASIHDPGLHEMVTRPAFAAWRASAARPERAAPPAQSAALNRSHRR